TDALALSITSASPATIKLRGRAGKGPRLRSDPRPLRSVARLAKTRAEAARHSQPARFRGRAEGCVSGGVRIHHENGADPACQENSFASWSTPIDSPQLMRIGPYDGPVRVVLRASA